MVHAGQHHGAVAFEPVDHRELPERPGGVEGVLVVAGRVVEQMALGAGGRERDVADVVVEVEVGIVDHWRPSMRCRRRGMRAAAWAMRRRKRATSGGRSRKETVRNVARRTGSRSIDHMSASVSLSRSSVAMDDFLTRDA